MYHTTPDDLARIANDLGQIARKYMAGSQELEQHISSLDNTASHLLYGGAQPWVGLASEAFQGAWTERRSRMQQASQLLSQAAQHLTRFAQTIDEYLPQIRLDQQLMQGPSSHMLAPDDQGSILSGESQAQNAILMAMQALNSQLEELAGEVRDCPEEQDESSPAWDNSYDNISRSTSGTSGAGSKTPEERIEEAVGDPAIALNIINLATSNGENLEDVATLLEKGVDPRQVEQWLRDGFKLDGASTLLNQGIEVNVVTQLINNRADLRDIATNSQILLDGGIKVDLINGWLKNGTNLNDAIAIMDQGVDLNLLGTSSRVGDFTGLAGATPNEIISRIPRDAKIEPWTPEPGGAQEGMKFMWRDTNGTWRVRLHDSNPNAPAGSNSASGWVMRVRRASQYMDATGTWYRDSIENPRSPYYNPRAINDTHIPIQAP